MEVTGCLTLKDLISTKKTRADQEKDARSSQKENMCDRFRISPRVPLKGEPIDLSKQKGLTPERYPITPVKVVDRPLADPWTPTANLKMLSSVASPEIRDREKKKELFRPIENNEDTGLDAQQFEAVDDMDDLEKRPSRKQKSLGLLCHKFLARYPSYPISTEKTTISLDEAASSLGVERRRIYDIVNVLESLNLVSRVAKNQYCWHGQHNLHETLRSLQREGERQKYSVQIAYFQYKELGTEQRKDYSINQLNLSIELSEVDCPSASASSRKDKSLRIMSQKFVMLFLVSTTKIITLEIAAKILIEESQDISDHSKFKTKVRRLYDIANVLTSLGLIKKVHVTEERGRKPAFKWIGPVDFKTESDQTMDLTTTTSQGPKRDAIAENNKQQRLLRHSSFNHVQSINTVKRKVCSEPSSPHKAQEALLEDNGYSSKMAHLAAICRQKIEEDSKCPKFASNPVPGNAGHLPFSFVVPVPVDPDYDTRDSGHQKQSASPNKLKSQLKVMASSNVEYGSRGFLPSQPYMYVPSTSVFMLCGNPGSEQSPDVMHGAGSPSPSDQKTTQDDDQPAKRQRIGSTDDIPLSLVVPKACSFERNICDTSLSHNSPELCKENLHSVPSPAGQEETTELMLTKEQEPQERVASAALPQYLYVPSAGGLNGFNFFLPASQTAGALGISQSSLPHLNVPYVMVPSTALAAFPFICSPAVTSSVSAASSDHALSTRSMNYSLPGMTTPPPHILFGTPSVVSPPIPEPSPDMQQSVTLAHASLQSASPVAADSSICAVQPLPVKHQKSPTPLTPKSLRPVHKDTFFKTPGSLGVSPALRKTERSHTRNSSSAQRRLDICSTTED